MAEIIELIPTETSKTEYQTSRLWIHAGMLTKLNKRTWMRLVVNRVDDVYLPSVTITTHQEGVYDLSLPVEQNTWIDLMPYCGSVMLPRARSIDSCGRIHSIFFEFAVIDSRRLRGAQT